MTGWLTLVGSGETAPGMAKVHRALLKALPEPPTAVFLNTPAGFELGLEAIARRFGTYFESRLDAPLRIASYRSAEDDPRDVAYALAALSDANYILAGPGSPTYAVRLWRDSAVFATVIERWLGGAQLVFASSAAIAISRHALPVYEIYKSGQPLHWVEGLDVLGRFGLELAIVTHWDNTEGGTHDTRACFMGMARFDCLRQLLPPTAIVLGIDEHTACTLDLDAGTAQIRGRGGVTGLRGNEVIRYKLGDSFPLSALQATRPAARPPEPPSGGPRGSVIAEASCRIASGDFVGGLRQAALAAPPELAAVLHQAALSIGSTTRADERFEKLVEILIQAREKLREAQWWDLADQLRDGLIALGIELRDTPEGTVWVREP